MQTDSSVKEISVISVVIAHSLAPSATLALKHTLCVSGHSDCSLSLSLSPSHLLHLSLSLSLCFLLCLLNVAYYFSTRRKLRCKANAVRSVVITGQCLLSVYVSGAAFVLCRHCMRHFHFHKRWVKLCLRMCVCVCEECTMRNLCVRRSCDTKELCQVSAV